MKLNGIIGLAVVVIFLALLVTVAVETTLLIVRT